MQYTDIPVLQGYVIRSICVNAYMQNSQVTLQYNMMPKYRQCFAQY